MIIGSHLGGHLGSHLGPAGPALPVVDPLPKRVRDVSLSLVCEVGRSPTVLVSNGDISVIVSEVTHG